MKFNFGGAAAEQARAGVAGISFSIEASPAGGSSTVPEDQPASAARPTKLLRDSTIEIQGLLSDAIKIAAENPNPSALLAARVLSAKVSRSATLERLHNPERFSGKPISMRADDMLEEIGAREASYDYAIRYIRQILEIATKIYGVKILHPVQFHPYCYSLFAHFRVSMLARQSGSATVEQDQRGL